MPAKIKTAVMHKKHRHKPKGVSAQAFERVHWPYIPMVLLISLLMSFGVSSGSLQAALHRPDSQVLSYATSMSVSGLLSSTNAARAANGVAPLQLNAKLDASAQAKANDMAARDYWSHNTPEGNPPWVFITAQGYDYQKLGENLATGFSNEQTTVDGWMASPPHRENLLDPAFVDVGFGFANNPDYTAAGGGPQTIVVAHYGRPAVLAAASPGPVAPPVAAPTRPPAPTPPPVTPPAPVAQATPPPAASPPPTPKKAAPIQTTAGQPPSQGITLSYKTSHAQLAFAQLPTSQLLTGLSIFGLIATIGLWLGRHLLILRRVLAYSEAYVIHHPLMDAGFMVLGVLFYLFSQTAGIIL